MRLMPVSTAAFALAVAAAACNRAPTSTADAFDGFPHTMRNGKLQSITLPVTHPIGVEASSLARAVKAGGVPTVSNYTDGDLLIMGSVLAVKANGATDTVTLTTEASPDHLSAIVMHDPRVIAGKLVSIACRKVNGEAAVVRVSACKFVIAA